MKTVLTWLLILAALPFAFIAMTFATFWDGKKLNDSLPPP